MSYLIFDRLPIEMRMMVFDHLVTDKSILGKLCLTSYNWKIITQNSYAWTLWVKSLLGRKQSQKWASNISWYNKIYWVNTYIWNPIFNIQFAPEQQVSGHVKNVLLKKFVFILGDEGLCEKQLEPVEWFYIFCKVGNLQSLRLLWHKFSHVIKDDLDKSRSLLYVCSSGNLKAVQFIYSIFYIIDDSNIKIDHNCEVYSYEIKICNNCVFRKALYIACKHNNLGVAQWLYSTLNYDLVCIRNDVAPSFAKACRYGYLSMAEWMFTTFGLTIEVIDDNHHIDYCAFILACQRGQLEIIRWLYSTFDINIELLRESDNSNLSLSGACEGGHFEVVKWLCSTFEFTINDFIGSFHPFQGAMGSGNLELSKYLHSKFKFTVDHIVDASDIHGAYHGLIEACEYNDVCIVEWICTTFSLIITHIKESKAFQNSCRNGSLNVLQWLCSHFPLTLIDIRNIDLLGTACVHDHLHIVQ